MGILSSICESVLNAVLSHTQFTHPGRPLPASTARNLSGSREEAEEAAAEKGSHAIININVNTSFVASTETSFILFNDNGYESYRILYSIIAQALSWKCAPANNLLYAAPSSQPDVTESFNGGEKAIAAIKCG